MDLIGHKRCTAKAKMNDYLFDDSYAADEFVAQVRAYAAMYHVNARCITTKKPNGDSTEVCIIVPEDDREYFKTIVDDIAQYFRE